MEIDMDGLLLEIRAAEGGDDSALLVHDFMAVYLRVAERSRL